MSFFHCFVCDACLSISFFFFFAMPDLVSWKIVHVKIINMWKKIILDSSSNGTYKKSRQEIRLATNNKNLANWTPAEFPKNSVIHVDIQEWTDFVTWKIFKRIWEIWENAGEKEVRHIGFFFAKCSIILPVFDTLNYEPLVYLKILLKLLNRLQFAPAMTPLWSLNECFFPPFLFLHIQFFLCYNIKQWSPIIYFLWE